jgi:electron transport complex protein RnfC
MSQHIGAPAEPCVGQGDRVCVGTPVGLAAGFVSAGVHSSVSGTVAAVSKIMSPSGTEITAVTVESDGLFTPDPSIKPPSVRTANDLADACAHAGLVGLGGAGFPTHVKLRPPDGSAVDTLLINAAECEPYLTSDYREMIERPESVVEGARLVKELLGLRRAVIGIEDNKPQAIRLMSSLCLPLGIEVAALKSFYPQGAEKFLIGRVTGRMVPSGGLPSDAGVVLLNVSTVSFITQYLKTGLPLVSRRITVDGGAVNSPGNLLVPVGTSVREVIEACGGYVNRCRKLIMGGPMMGVALYEDDFPVLKHTNGILALDDREVKLTADYPCIRCGRCVDTCPMSLSPAEIQTAYSTEDPAWAGRMGVLNCIECGCCTYVCPAKRPITQIMRLSKAQIRKAAESK